MKYAGIHYFLTWLRSAKSAAKRLYHEEYGYHASALAFITILSLVPLFTVILYFFTFFPHFTRLVTIARDYAYQNFLPPSNNVVQSYLYLFINQAKIIPLGSIFFLVVTSVLLMMTIESSFNRIWHVRNKHISIKSFIFLGCLLLFFPVFIGFVMLITKYLYTLLWLKPYQIELLNFSNLIINSFIFTLFYVLGPTHVVSWRNGILVGIATAITFYLLKKSFVIYIDKFSSYEMVYGTLAVIPILLLWIYLCWYMVLFFAILLQIKDQHDFGAKHAEHS